MIEKTDKKVKVLRFIGMILIMAILLTMPVFATANYGENAGKWILDQLFWVAVVVIAIVFVGLLIKRNFTGMAITGLVGAVALFIIREPQRLETIGNTLWGLISSGT